MLDSSESISNEGKYGKSKKIDLLFTGNNDQINLLVSNLKRCKTNIMECKDTKYKKDELFVIIRNYFKEFKNENNEHLNEDLTKEICLFFK